MIKDSGDRREFETGAVRDMAEGKGRCDLLPACALLRLSKHYEAGAKKYAERNWEKGIPISVMVDSGYRHLLKYLDGQTDEDHLVAAAWNILGAMWMEEKRPDLQDIPTRTADSCVSRNIDTPNPTSNISSTWLVWAGWRGNHDLRLEGAKCSRCDYIHPTVYKSLKELNAYCPNCGDKKTSIEEI